MTTNIEEVDRAVKIICEILDKEKISPEGGVGGLASLLVLISITNGITKKEMWEIIDSAWDMYARRIAEKKLQS